MKKFLLSIFAVLFAFAGVQAQEVTLDFTSNGWGFPSGSSNKTAAQKTYTNSGYSIVLEGGGSSNGHYYNTSGYLMLGKNNATLTLPVFDFAVSKIEVVGNKGASSSTLENIYVGNTAVSTQCKGSANNNTFEINSDYQAAGNVYVLKIESAHNAQITKINIYKAETTGEDGGETPVVPTAEKPVFNPESKEFNLGESVTVEISAAEGATIYYTTDGETPTEESNVYENALTITETTTVKAIAVMDGYNNSAVAEATYTAVDPNAKTATFDFTNPAGLTPSVTEFTSSAYNTSNTTFTNGGVTLNTTDGSTASRIWKGSSAYDFRIYSGGSITIAAPAGGVLTSIEFTGNTVTPTPNVGNFSNKIWTGNAPSVVFTVRETQKINTITVTYSIDESVVIIDQPSIAGEATFVGSTTVEITNNAEGTTLYYSTNGEDYVAYNGALNISETTTVYAKAVDAQGNESSVAEATFTKLELLSIAEAKAAYDAASANVNVAMDITGAVVTVNNGQYMFIENETTGINIYNSGAKYAVGTKFTSGYILGTSAVYGKMHQITNAEFNNVETTTIEVVPTEVAVADLNANFDTYEGRFVRLTDADINGNNIAQGENAFALYNRFDFITAPTSATGCDIEGIVARYNATLQIFPVSISNTINVTDAGFATLYLAYPVVIPADVKVYTVTEVGAGYVTLTQVTGVLPANTGVIVEAGKGSYDFVYSADEATAVTDNKLLGSAVNTYVSGDAYVLGNVNGIGLYKAVLNKNEAGEAGTTHFKNNANKAYLPASVASGAASYSFRFGEGTTGIDEITDNRVQSTVIYDLTGRRVENISAPGIYIINGVKTLVK